MEKFYEEKNMHALLVYASLLFNFSDGLRTFTDAGGIELTGLAAAKAHAIAQVRDLKGR